MVYYESYAKRKKLFWMFSQNMFKISTQRIHSSSNLAQHRVILKFIVILTASISDARHKQLEFALVHKQVQLITIHSKDFSDKGRAIKGLVICWMFLNLISNKRAMPLGSVDDQIEGKSRPNEVIGKKCGSDRILLQKLISHLSVH